eukprot:gnl/Spiro4/14257_TR7667_c0_g1_i1.p1 gnl/Spiro4/14257_TR7667_c0_g1~~gnl/Spiro4/14257_TR7667_c0_g1_i1.p1  ORF type:complete len:424 (+),score=87.40 gnl/Spiro4/14257_TR7667_c0_g1_i1:32-1273(+)
MSKALCVCVFLLASVIFVSGAEQGKFKLQNLSRDALVSFAECGLEVQLADELLAGKHISEAEASAVIANCEKRVSDAAGVPITQVELREHGSQLEHSVQALLQAQETVKVEAQAKENSIAGYFSVVTVVFCLAIVMVVGGISVLVGVYIYPYIALLPIVILELLGYVACFCLIYYARLLSPYTAPFVCATGCLGFTPLLGFSIVTRVERKNRPKDSERFIAFLGTISFCLWSACAIYYDSRILGSVSVVLVALSLNMYICIAPGCIAMGFDNDNAAARAAVVCFFMWTGFTLQKVLGNPIPYIHVFDTAALLVGSYGYFLATLVLGFDWRGAGFVADFFFFFGALLAIFCGSAFSIPQLTGCAGTFGTIWVCGKYWQIPVMRDTFPWSILTFGLMLYGLAYFLTAHPEFFVSF